MSTLNIVDTETLNADPLRELILFAGVLNQSTEVSETSLSDNDGTLPIRTSTIEIVFPPTLTEERILELTDAMEGLSVLSHRTRITLPNTDDEEAFNYNNYVSDAFSYYNLRNDEYETYTQINNEKILPNFCLGALWSRGEQTSEQENYYTMFGTIPGLIDSDVLAPATPINLYEFDDEYLTYSYTDPEAETLTDYYKLMLASGSVSRTDYSEANTHVYVDFNYSLNDTAKVGNTPFFNRIRLPFVNKRVPISLPNGTEYFLETNSNFPSEIARSFIESSMSDKLLKSFRNSNSFLREFNINGSTAELKVYDLMEMLESIGYGGSITQTDEMFLRSEVQNYAIDDNSPFTFYFYKLILLGKIRAKMRAKLKKFKELIVENQEHDIEHVGFKVIKKIEGRSTPIQTFYFLNRASLEDFIDTQIKFDRVYNYEVIGMFAIYGSNYSYENVQKISGFNPLSNEPVKRINFTFTNSPSVKIVEVSMATHTLRIVEPPPIVPEITFYNEMTTKNKLKIRMEHQDGNIVDEYRKVPLRPFAGNQNYIDKLKQYFSSDNVLVTSGKTSEGIYEIYRLEDPPSSYLDFEDALIATVQSNIVYSNGEHSRNAMFTDLIKHQKKYYYAFRTLTHRGNPSELSPIYVAEMYEDADETFMTFDLYQMPENKNSQPDSHMRKYIQIIPNTEHLVPNSEEIIEQFPDATSAITALKLGRDELEEKLFEYNSENKYIKLRLESKNSGRKMDLNLFFKRKTTNN